MRNSNAEFDALHLGSGVLRDERTVRFGDGAVRELRVGGKTEAPPTDSFQLARLKLRFHRILLQQLTAAYAELQSAFAAKTAAKVTAGITADPDAEELQRLEQRCVDAKVKFAEAQLEYEGLAVAVGDAGPDH